MGALVSRTAIRSKKSRRANRIYLLWAFTGALSASLALAASVHLLSAVAVLTIFGLMSALWLVGYLRDGVAVLTAYLVSLFVIPATLSVVGLRSLGAPAFLIAGGLGVWWGFERLWPAPTTVRAARPIHILLGLYVACWFASYALAHRFVHAGAESRAMDRSLMVVIGCAGVALSAADGTPTRERLHVLGRRLVYLGSYVALVAILQSRKIYDLAALDLPGLTTQGDGATTYDIRSGFERIKSTTLHPIELAAVLGVLFPLALHYLVHARSARERAAMVVATGLIGVAMPMAVTRTGVLAFGVAMLVLVPAWPRAWRKKFYIFMGLSLVAVRVALPGLLGTLRALFTQSGDDPSVTGRTEDFPLIFDLIGRHAAFGMGPGTFSPVKYFFLDNQFLGTAVELGGVGVTAMIALFLGAPVVAAQGARLSARVEDRLFARALSAGVIAGFATFFTFDALAFPVITGVLFIYIGMMAALYRFGYEEAGDGAEVTTKPHSESRDGAYAL